MNTLPFAPRRVHPDGTEKPAGAYPAFAEGWATGWRAAHAARGAAFAPTGANGASPGSGSTAWCLGRQRATSMR